MNKYFCETKEVNKMESVLFDVDTFIKTLYEYKPNNIFNSKFSNSYPCWVIVNYLPGNRIKYFANGWANKTPIIEDLKDVYTSWKIQGLKYCYFSVEDQSDKNNSAQKKMDEKLDDLLSKVEDSLKVSINKGIILGMKESLNSLNQFIDEKQKMGLPESISKFELNTFLEEYIRLMENK